MIIDYKHNSRLKTLQLLAYRESEKATHNIQLAISNQIEISSHR